MTAAGVPLVLMKLHRVQVTSCMMSCYVTHSISSHYVLIVHWLHSTQWIWLVTGIHCIQTGLTESKSSWEGIRCSVMEKGRYFRTVLNLCGTVQVWLHDTPVMPYKSWRDLCLSCDSYKGSSYVLRLHTQIIVLTGPHCKAAALFACLVAALVIEFYHPQECLIVFLHLHALYRT